MSTGSKPEPGALTREVAGILRAEIARHRLLQGDVAKAAGMSPNQLSGILRGNKHVDLDQLDRLCWALGLSFRDVAADADRHADSRQADPNWDTPQLT